MNKIYILLIAILLYSCNKETQQVKKKKLDYFVEHSCSVEGKKIKFSLPKWYTNKNIENKRKLSQYVDCDDIRFSEFVFFSTKNDNSFFSMFIVDDSLGYYNIPEDLLVDSFASYYLEHYSIRSPGTVFKEKGFYKDNRPYYILMASSRHPYKMDCDDNESFLYKSDSIESEFIHVTYFGMKRYVLLLSSIENIKEFSYEEKRQVLESISIE